MTNPEPTDANRSTDPRMNDDPPIWIIGEGDKLVPMSPSFMPLEKRLEALIESNPSCLGDPMLVIARQLLDRVDLLAIDVTGRLRVLELKRGQTPRETIAQTLEYLAWVRALSTEKIWEIFESYQPGVDLAAAFFERFGRPLPIMLNQSQAVTIVAATVDPKTKDVVRLLQDHRLSISVVEFDYYPGLNAIKFRPDPIADQDMPGEEGQSRPASARELARLQASIDRLGADLEEFRPTLEALKRPIYAATTYSSAPDVHGVDKYVLLFWLTYAWRFVWDFVPFSFIFELYQHWHRTQSAEGLHLPELKPEVFGQRLAAAAAATSEWRNTRQRPENLMDTPEPLAKLMPAWSRPGTDQNVHGYLRSAMARRGISRQQP